MQGRAGLPEYLRDLCDECAVVQVTLLDADAGDLPRTSGSSSKGRRVINM